MTRNNMFKKWQIQIDSSSNQIPSKNKNLSEKCIKPISKEEINKFLIYRVSNLRSEIPTRKYIGQHKEKLSRTKDQLQWSMRNTELRKK